MAQQFPQKEVVATTPKHLYQTVHHRHHGHTRVHARAGRQQIFRETEALQFLLKRTRKVLLSLRLAQLHRIQKFIVHLQILVDTISDVKNPVFVTSKMPGNFSYTLGRNRDVPLTESAKERVVNPRTRPTDE